MAQLTFTGHAMAIRGLLARIRDAVIDWRPGLSAGGLIVLYEIAARIGIPGVDARIIRDWVTGTGGAFIQLYNFISGGGTARGTLLALGIMPYVGANIYLFIGRTCSARIRRATDTEEGRSRAIHGLTLGLAVVQAIGYVNFAAAIPGAVTAQGPLFVVRTLSLLTGGALAAGLLAEQLLKRRQDEETTMIAACPAESSPQSLPLSPFSMPSRSAPAPSTAAASSPPSGFRHDANSASSPEN